MAGRFPFDANAASRQQQQLNSAAQMRAALGLPPTNVVDVEQQSLYLQAQRQQQDLQRDFQLRQLLLQEQIDQHLGEQRLRATLGDRLAADYRTLLLNEQRAQQQHLQLRSRADEQQAAYLREQHVAAAAAQAAAQQQQQQAVAQAAQWRYQDEIRRHHQLGSAFRSDDTMAPPKAATADAALGFGPASSQQKNPSTLSALAGVASPAGVATAPTVAAGASLTSLKSGMTAGSLDSQAAALLQLKQLQTETEQNKPKEAPQAKQPTKRRANKSQQAVADSKKRKQGNKKASQVGGCDTDNQPQSGDAASLAAAEQLKRQQEQCKAVASQYLQIQAAAAAAARTEKPTSPAPKKAAGRGKKKAQNLGQDPDINSQAKQKPPAKRAATARKPRGKQPRKHKSPVLKSATAIKLSKLQKHVRQHSSSPNAQDDSMEDSDSHPLKSELGTAHSDADGKMPAEADRYSSSDESSSPKKGSLEELLSAAEDVEQVNDAVDVLNTLKHVDWSSDKEEAARKLSEVCQDPATSLKPAEMIILDRFQSFLPALPSEPMLLVDTTTQEMDVDDMASSSSGAPMLAEKEQEVSDERASHSVTQSSQKPPQKKISAALDYPYPVDTWWPSNSGIQRERHNEGEETDEDMFEEAAAAPAGPNTSSPLRANERKITKRLTSCVEPGVMEKLPHCRIHRVRIKNKKNSTAPELVYCFQVTELYPNDLMVNCSECGTWRHAACGGHHETYSTRKNAMEPFVAVCENCHEERKFLDQSPKGKQRLERQRLEHLRRTLATSSVMRHASFSKHGGTYKWPLGSVSATHIGGHTRSVHSRHDKAEKQWADMVSRLSRGFGYRQKERVRVRTKELERLLVSIEDAENYTDRHNMLLFLMRDTAQDVPIGFEHEPRNLMDPAYDTAPGAAASVAVTADSTPPLSPEQQPQGGKLKEGSDDEEEEEVDASPVVCARIGCERSVRFDSIFCSDGCGVLSLEADLMRAFHDASDIHPSVLRHS